MAQLLLVDDDPETLAGVGSILRLAGYEVVTASSGREGIDLLEQDRVDLIPSDLRLPDISGVEVLRYVRRSRPTVPFVVVTGVGSTRDIVEVIRLGAADYLEKPV